MAPSTMQPDDINAIAEAVEAKRSNSGIHKNPLLNGNGEEKTDPGEPKKEWWQTLRVPLAAAAGALVAIVGIVFTAGISWGGSQHEVGVIKADVAQVKAELATKADASAAAEREKRLREVEKDNAANNAANTADHTAIKKDVVEMKGDVKEVRAAQVEQDKKLDRLIQLVKMKP